jgi:hypothetical protein
VPDAYRIPKPLAFALPETDAHTTVDAWNWTAHVVAVSRSLQSGDVKFPFVSTPLGFPKLSMTSNGSEPYVPSGRWFHAYIVVVQPIVGPAIPALDTPTMG